MDTHAPSTIYSQNMINQLFCARFFHKKCAKGERITILKNCHCFWNVLTLVVLASPPQVAAACSRNLDETES